LKTVSPTLMLDKAKCLKNIEKMSDKARALGVRFRPHFKTHQSKRVGGWFRNFGVDAITVSSVKMAAYFAGSGFNDITVAFPVDLNEIGMIDELARRVSINVLVESLESVSALERGLGSNVGVFIKIDSGYGRTGIDAKDLKAIDALSSLVGKSSKLSFKGFLTHAGHSYKAKSVQEILAVHLGSLAEMRALKESFTADWPNLEISVGDTPCCSVACDFPGVDEMRPGNFVFYDAMQSRLGSCVYDQIAVALACPIVARHAGKNTFIIHGGAAHLSKESEIDSNGDQHFGLLVRLNPDGWEEPIAGARVTGLSQEHGIVSVTGETYDRFKVGDVVGILPVHSCLTANLMRGYLTLEGDIVDHMQGRSFRA
jgi:D-serine deaminase-like pyridoxal phosphate-dependent protein